jgi:hypothetical protein
MTFHTQPTCVTAGGTWDATNNCCIGFNCTGDTIDAAECTRIGKVWNPQAKCCVGYAGCTAPPPPPVECPPGEVGTPPNCRPKPDYPRPRPGPGYPYPRPGPSYPRPHPYPRPGPYYPRPRPYYRPRPPRRVFWRGRWWLFRFGRWMPIPRPRYGGGPYRSYYGGGCTCG